MSLERPPITKQSLWFGVLGTAAVATVVNLLILPIWFTLLLSFGATDVSPESGIFAACEPGSEICAQPDAAFIILIVITIIGHAAGAARLGQLLGRLKRRPKIFLILWLFAAVLMALEAWIFIF